MLITGTYKTVSGLGESVEYLINICSTKTAERWTLFSPIAQEDTEAYRLHQALRHRIISVAEINSDRFAGWTEEDLAQYTVGSMLLSHNGTLSAFMGDTSILAGLMDGLSSSGMMYPIRQVLAPELYHSQVTSQDEAEFDLSKEPVPDLAEIQQHPERLSRLLNYAYSKASDILKVPTSKYLVGRYTLTTGAVFEIVTTNAFFRSAVKLKGLHYQSVGEYYVERLDVAARRTRIRSWDQIKAEKGAALSWLYDERGRFRKDYRIINTEKDLQWVIDEISKPEIRLVTWDTETTGLNVFYMPDVPERRSGICGMSLTWREDQGVYIPFKSNKFDVLDVKDTLDRLCPIMATKILGGHNSLFDMRVFKSLGYYVKNSIDTLLLEFIFDPYVSKGSKALKAITRKYFGHETLELDDILGGVVDAELIPDLDYETIKVYGCADSDYVYKIIKLKLGELTPALQRVFNLDNQIAPILSNAEYYGAHINQRLLHVLSEINRKDLTNLTKIMYEYLEDVGSKTLARMKVLEIYESAGIDSDACEEDVQKVLQDPEFRDSIAPLFRKQTKKNQDKLLEFSSYVDVTNILYSLLQYPITRRDPDTQKPRADSEALEDLMSYKATIPVKFLAGDIISDICNHPELNPTLHEKVLIDRDKFEGMQYPFAYLLTEWRALYKLRTSFFDSLLAKEQGEYYYTTNSMTSAETGRIINPIQTLIGQLKKLIIPYNKDYYLCVFDMAQIEYRVMLGLAVSYWNAEVDAQKDPKMKELLKTRDIEYLIDKLGNPEADYHREGGAVFIGTTPEDMTKTERKDVKSIHFSVPYGASAFSVAKESLRKARTPKQIENVIEKTSLMLGSWQKNLYPLYYFLERKRDQALIPVPENELPKDKHGKWGKVTNAFGRFRWFNLNDLDNKGKASVRRMAGNYPIQSFAREIFCTIFNRIYKRLVAEGYIDLTAELPKVIMSLFIHDEVVIHVHKSINPYAIYKIVYEECMAIKFKHHPPYYMGLAIVNNWYDGKSDKYEAPVDFVREMVEKYDANPEYYNQQHMFNCDACDYVYFGIKRYMTRRYLKEIAPYVEETDTQVKVDMDKFIPVFKNYFLKPRLEVHYRKHRELRNVREDNLVALYEEPLVLHYKEKPVWITYSGETYCVQDSWGAEQVAQVIESDKEYSTHWQDKQSDEDSAVDRDSAVQEDSLGVAKMFEIEQGDSSETNVFSDAEFDDVFANLDSFEFSNSGDTLEDTEERDERVALEASLLSEAERSVYIDTDIKLYTDEETESKHVVTKMYDLGYDRIVIDVSGVDKPTFMKLREYLMSNLDVVGRNLYFMQGEAIVATNKKINYIVSPEKVNELLGVKS